MKTVRPYLFLIIALLAGWTLGSDSTDRYYDKWIKHYQARIAFDGLADRFTTLKALRAGDTNAAAESLESQMDSQILLVGALLQEIPADQLPSRSLQLLPQLQDYRAAHPHQTSRPEIDKVVASVLASTNLPNRQ